LLHFATHETGSSGTCARNGYEYAASTTLMPVALSAAFASPSVYSDTAAGCDESSVARAAYPALLCAATGPSSQVTCSFWRALCAAQKWSATIATPGISP